MQPGDHVEFLSDRQTDKGPSAGAVRGVNNGKVLISHSDCNESFRVSDLMIHMETTHHKGGVLWLLV